MYTVTVAWSRVLGGVLIIGAFVTGCERCSTGAGRGGDAAAVDARPPSKLGAQPIVEGWEEVDPYCGMRLRRSEAAATATHRGRTYYFCLTDHRDAFVRDPDRYLGLGGGDAGTDDRTDGAPTDADAREAR